MEIHQLRYFVAVAEEGSFSNAAEREHVSQPSLSQQIHKLEEELNQQLFDRLPRSVVLTEAGRTLLFYARQILSGIAEARQAVTALEDEVADLPDKPAPVRGAHAAPRTAIECLAGSGHGPVDVFASPSATLARVSPVAGFGVSNVLPDAASVHCPSMNSFRGAAVNSSTLLSTVTVHEVPHLLHPW